MLTTNDLIWPIREGVVPNVVDEDGGIRQVERRAGQHRLSSLQARFGALGDSWQDQEHAKFSDEFKQTMKALKKFVEMSDQHVPYLMRKVQRIEEYLKQR